MLGCFSLVSFGALVLKSFTELWYKPEAMLESCFEAKTNTEWT